MQHGHSEELAGFHCFTEAELSEVKCTVLVLTVAVTVCEENQIKHWFYHVQCTLMASNLALHRAACFIFNFKKVL